jgi:hypothetical protein
MTLGCASGFARLAIAARDHERGRNMQYTEATALERLVGAIFEHAESSLEEASTIARHLVAANLVGHDSHG